MSISEKYHSMFVLFFLSLKEATTGPRIESSAVARGLICCKINMLRIPEFMDRQMAMYNSDRKVRHFCKSFWKVLVKHSISSTECATGNKEE